MAASSNNNNNNNKRVELNITTALKECGVKRFSRQGALLRIDHSLEKNGKLEWKIILFEVKPDFFATLRDFEDKCYRQKISTQLVQQIMAALCRWTMTIMKMH